ncbi:MAG TPA: histidine phosphatase family protein [Xanthobacteraceae bacterium]|nr:histidine phosphatase family protein [Xanthobacteraceae bacterium]
MTKILLTRHGHVEGITPERFRGRQPLDLTARGRREAAAVAERIAGAFRPSKIYTSPLGRCVETGAAIAKACGIAAEVCGDLIDLDYGAWQFQTFDHARKDDPALFAAWFATPQLVRFPNGESLQDLAARAADTLRFLLARHPADTVVVVGHDSVNRVLLLQCLDLPLSSYWRIAQAPCCLNEIDIDGGKICVVRINETRHLDGIAE